jgi:hypothetical protein
MANPYFIVDMKDNQKLRDLRTRIVEHRQMVIQQFEFLKKQAENLNSDAEKVTDELWSEVKAELQAIGLLPSIYDGETYTLGFDDESTQLFMEKKDDPMSIHEILSRISRK